MKPKRFLAAVLAVIMVFVAVPATGVVAETEGLYTYTVADGEATITGFDQSYSGDVVIPDTLGGCPVVTIGRGAFSYCYNLTSVTIPDGVTSIGDEAFFDCYNLISIFIPDSVTNIGEYAFYWCRKLTSIVIPESVTNIGEWAFFACRKLTNVTIPESVTNIGVGAFQECSGLTTITIPDSVTSIGNAAFASCPNLTISCYENSTAHTYAIDNSIPYELISDTTVISGDVDGDGDVDSTDVATLFRYLKGADITVSANADVNGDEAIDNIDYSILKRIVKGVKVN